MMYVLGALPSSAQVPGSGSTDSEDFHPPDPSPLLPRRHAVPPPAVRRLVPRQGHCRREGAKKFRAKSVWEQHQDGSRGTFGSRRMDLRAGTLLKRAERTNSFWVSRLLPGLYQYAQIKMHVASPASICRGVRSVLHPTTYTTPHPPWPVQA